MDKGSDRIILGSSMQKGILSEALINIKQDEGLYL
jgi:hypothetical protein